ncbi:MAG: tripartite tricarboxylate transporter substrate binding protein [Pseudomonadota bacterium]|nr:tripartite tricarboxylate transporter substrate binding protein [Pseudomonadota bacterium]
MKQFVAIAVVALAGVIAPAHAQSWPEKPVKLILSQPPGSGPDVVARILGDRLSKTWGQGVVIDNRPGGQNAIGAQAAARSPADGYSFYFATTAALVTNAYLFKTLPYDPQKDFVPVAFIGKSPFAMLVKADSPIKSLEDLVAKAKAEPGIWTIANEGPKTFSGMISRLFVARTRTDFNLVPYVSIGAAVQNTLGGHTNVVVADIASTAQLVKQGQLRMLAVTSGQRVPGWDNVPALSETLPGFDMVGWFAIVAPARTPAAAIQRLNRDVDAALRDKDVAERIHAAGPMTQGAGTPDELAAFLAAEHQRWAAITREIGILPE